MATSTRTRLWHPFAAMGKVDGHELVLARGEGCRVWDADGNEYLDATAGLWFANVGHGRGEIADAVAAQLRTLAAHHVFGDQANRAGARARGSALAALAPVPDAAVFFGTGGGEAVDTAAKIVRRYWALVGQPQRTVIVSRSFAYHGTNAYGTSLSGIPAVRDGFGTLVGDVRRGCPRRRRRARTRTLDELGDRAAAFIGEPMIGAGGAIPPPDGYWPAVERICRERGVLLIADEVISGFGRLGRWFGCERYGFTPDLMTCAKGISSGYVPLGAVVVQRPRAGAVLGRDAAPVPPRRHVRGAPGSLRRRARQPRHHRARRACRPCRRPRAVLRDLLAPLRDLPGVAKRAQRRPRRRRRARRGPARGAPGLRHGDGRGGEAPRSDHTSPERRRAPDLSPLVVTEDELTAIVGRIGAAVTEVVAAL